MSPIMGTEVVAAGLWEEIGDTELLAPAASVSFAGIAAGYAAFLLLWHDVYGDDAVQQAMGLTFNADVGNNYDYSDRPFNSASLMTLAATQIYFAVCGDTPGDEIHDTGYALILNRAANEKLVIGVECRVFKAGANAEKIYGYHIEAKWRNVAAEISTITITPSVGNFVAGSRFILLGVPT